MTTEYTDYIAGIESDLYTAGRSCDGRPYYADKYYVMIENSVGRRFRHNATFNSAEVVVCDETGETGFVDLRLEAYAKATRLAARVNDALASGSDLDWTHWYEIDPAYGSDEYFRQGIEPRRSAAERAADMD